MWTIKNGVYLQSMELKQEMERVKQEKKGGVENKGDKLGDWNQLLLQQTLETTSSMIQYPLKVHLYMYL